MNAVRRFPCHESPGASLNRLEQKALLRLLEAANSALRFKSDKWQFALELHDLAHDGITASVLRGLVLQGLVTHAWETTRVGAQWRTMRSAAHLHFIERSCFTLTEAGMSIARHLWNRPVASPSPVASPCAGNATGTHEGKPPQVSFGTCANGCRELRVGNQLVKCFRTYARYQETILAEFQRRGWVEWISDPLPRAARQNPKTRLRDVIARLNRNQIHRLLRFHGDGNGRGIRLEVLEVLTTPTQQARNSVATTQ